MGWRDDPTRELTARMRQMGESAKVEGSITHYEVRRLDGVANLPWLYIEMPNQKMFLREHGLKGLERFRDAAAPGRLVIVEPNVPQRPSLSGGGRGCPHRGVPRK